MRGFLVCGFEELPGFLTRAAIAELTGGSALMEKEYVQAEAYAEEYARGLPVATAEPIMGEVVGAARDEALRREVPGPRDQWPRTHGALGRRVVAFRALFAHARTYH